MARETLLGLVAKDLRLDLDFQKMTCEHLWRQLMAMSFRSSGEHTLTKDEVKLELPARPEP